jgi:hypothetical protein
MIPLPTFHEARRQIEDISLETHQDLQKLMKKLLLRKVQRIQKKLSQPPMLSWRD